MDQVVSDVREGLIFFRCVHGVVLLVGEYSSAFLFFGYES